MEWKLFSECYPQEEERVLITLSHFLDHIDKYHYWIAIGYVQNEKVIIKEIENTCAQNDVPIAWKKIPISYQPERLSEKTSKEDAIV